MKGTIGFLAALMVSAVPGSSLAAAPHKYSKIHTDCIDKANSIDSEMAGCDYAELERVDRHLNQVYRELIGHMDPVRKPSLVKSEKAWLNYRDSECDLRASAEEGGTLAKLIRSGCLLEMTADRVTALKDYLDLELKYGL